MITILGAGDLASALARAFHRGGSRIRILARRREAAEDLAREVDGTAGVIGEPLESRIVVLAVPADAVPEVAHAYASDLDGRIVVDPAVPARPLSPSSATVRLQRAFPGAAVLKAFSTTFAGALAANDPGDGLPVVLVAGDDTTAREAFCRTLQDHDIAALAVGGLDWSTELDALAVLQVALAERGLIGRSGGFALRY